MRYIERMVEMRVPNDDGIEIAGKIPDELINDKLLGLEFSEENVQL